MNFTKLFTALATLGMLCSGVAAAAPIDPQWMCSISNRHDLTLPEWGPYTKRYIGISHVPPKNQGLRFDVSVFPGVYRRKVTLPNVMFENDYHPWEAAP